MTIYFDMDGTIANLYGVENWLDYLKAYDTTPYEIAKPLIHFSTLARMLNRLKQEGYTLGIISWCSKNGTSEYNDRTAKAKRNWLAKHLPSVQFDIIHIIPYGTPKTAIMKEMIFCLTMKKQIVKLGRARLIDKMKYLKC